ncbi:MAG: DNA-processing protein DprA [Anaerolineae bacterium]|nr:DNA-processing protein DprA [Anaerolineae bacterium]
MLDELAWIALSLQPHIGSKTLSQLLARFGSASGILAAESQELQEVRGIGTKLAAAIQAIDLDHVQRDCEQWARSGVQLLPHYHAHYPLSLRALDDAPATLFVYGDILMRLPQQAVAVIGTRDPSTIARQAAYRLGALLAQAGLLVVSGMASGIDAAAHEGAMNTANGVTLAMLGSGVLRPYPPQHEELARRISQRGALACECAPDATPNAPRLVSRNRLITGMATNGVIVVESTVEGGAMHAARFAQLQGRSLYALDLPASGNQALIADGAVPLAADVANLDFLTTTLP